MAQGLVKKKAAPASAKRATQAPKRIGPRNVAPKKQSLIKQKKLTKVRADCPPTDHRPPTTVVG
ncbi:hypothetical protein BDV59DRAFT_180983 [Aspergillus ambiguus]|uniref:uncharacterized protein n=1 Tax=Aspergillus ambiguus TaxID=176160 RepID=UPI003CCCDBA2